MNTKLYRNVDGEDYSFLVFHISNEESFSDLEKFTGGMAVLSNKGYLIKLSNVQHNVDIGDYVVHITGRAPFTRVGIIINKVRHIVPNNSYMICKPEEFEANFKEVPVG